MSETKDQFYFQATDEWDKDEYDNDCKTTLSVDFIENQSKQIYFEACELIDGSVVDTIALELTKDQSLQLAYALLRINWELDKSQGVETIGAVGTLEGDE